MKIFDRIFSDRYVNKAATVDNAFLLGMYRFVYPFAYQLNRFGLTPDQITTLSLLSAVLGFISLATDADPFWFWLCWGCMILFDFCDGTVARMSNRVSTRAFRYDHMGDIFKIFLVVLGAALRFNDQQLWILGAIFVFVYPYSEIVAHDLKYRLERTPKVAADVHALIEFSPAQDEVPRPRLRERIPLIGLMVKKTPWLHSAIRQAYICVTTFNGQTLLVFLALPVGGWVAKVTLLYVLALIFKSCLVDIKLLWQMPR